MLCFKAKVLYSQYSMCIYCLSNTEALAVQYKWWRVWATLDAHKTAGLLLTAAVSPFFAAVLEQFAAVTTDWSFIVIYFSPNEGSSRSGCWIESCRWHCITEINNWTWILVANTLKGSCHLFSDSGHWGCSKTKVQSWAPPVGGKHSRQSFYSCGVNTHTVKVVELSLFYT